MMRQYAAVGGILCMQTAILGREVAINQLLNQGAAIGSPEHSILAHIILVKLEGL